MSESDADAGETAERLLAEADDLLAEADDPEELLGEDDLQSLADEARAFFEDAGTAELLDAVGVDTSGSSEPRDLLPALAEADDESVVRFRRLKLLSGLEGDEEDRSALETFEALGAVLDEDAETDVDLLDGDGIDVEGIDVLGDDSDESADETAADEAGSEAIQEEEEEEAEAEAETETAETEEEAEAEAETTEAEEDSQAEAETEATETDEETEAAEGEEVEAAEAEEGAEADEEEGGIAEHAGALKGVLDEIKERVPDESDRGAPAEGASGTGDDAEGDDAEKDEESDPSSGGATGPPSDRPDMRAPARFSTMPDK